MITPEDEALYKLPPLPDPPFVGTDDADRLQLTYEGERRQHRVLNPIIEITGPFVITPELEQERAERIAGQQWREPETEEEFAVSVTDIPLRVGLLSQP